MRLLFVCGVMLVGGCVGLVPAATETASVGRAAQGFLTRGIAIPDDGEGFVRARPGESTRFGTAETVGAIERAAAAVARRYPGTFPLRIGDLGAPFGGAHSRHHSHRSGRDVDVIYYAVDGQGRSVQGRGWLAYDRFGLARETRAPAGASPSREIFFFDAARNWTLVRTLVMDEDAPVQWIFCSRGIKARLLRYAAAHESNPEAIFRATWALHQPRRGNPHADHFHVRFSCTARQRSLGCFTVGYLWPWIRQATAKPAFAGAAQVLDDATVVRLLMRDGVPDDDARRRE